jgi:hypothetical protein
MDHSLTPFKIGKCQLDNSASSKLITSLSPLLRGIFEMEEWKLGTIASMKVTGNFEISPHWTPSPMLL